MIAKHTCFRRIQSRLLDPCLLACHLTLHGDLICVCVAHSMGKANLVALNIKYQIVLTQERATQHDLVPVLSVGRQAILSRGSAVQIFGWVPDEVERLIVDVHHFELQSRERLEVTERAVAPDLFIVREAQVLCGNHLASTVGLRFIAKPFEVLPDNIHKISGQVGKCGARVDKADAVLFRLSH